MIECLADELPIVYIDESGFELESNRAYSYGLTGCRVFDSYNWQVKHRTNAIGALINNQLLTVGLYDCSITGDVFMSWLQEDLLPQLKQQSVLVMDNASFHKGRALIDCIKLAGHHIVWLPKYSPHLNPIEKAWSRIKSIRKKYRVQDIDELFRACYNNLFGN